MRIGSDESAGALLQMSALADGELDAAATRLACAHWRADAAARSAWHAYHLIGDVLRSDELAADAGRDASFLEALRRRLAAEPVPFAPRSIDAPGTPAEAVRRPARPKAWTVPAALAAGLVAAVSVFVVMRATAPAPGADAILASTKSDGGVAGIPVRGEPSGPGGDAAGELQTLVTDGKLVRDARLDRYFAAHTQFGGSSALGMPSGFLRAATTQATER